MRGELSEEAKSHLPFGGTCPYCGCRVFYDERYDAYYCSVCNTWLEEACRDPECEFCSCRPKRPVRAGAKLRAP